MVAITNFIRPTRDYELNKLKRSTHIAFMWQLLNHHIPIHDHSWMQHQWKQTDGAFASLALLSAKNLENSMILTLVWSWRSYTKRRLLIPTRIGDLKKKSGTFP